MTKFALTTTAALIVAGSASAQMFGGTYGSDLDMDRFGEGFASTGYYGALDRNDDAMLDNREFSTGLYRTYDRDRDLQITPEEFETGYGRDLGEDYDASMFETYDADASGVLTQEEFGTFYGERYGDYYSSYDADADGMINEQEFGEGVYRSADRNQDMQITVEEEGFFEGWFDGDEIDAEIEQVGDVYSDV